MKIAHLVYQSLPNISGSSIRTRDIVYSQKSIGLEPFVISSPFQNGITNDKVEIINEIKHYRTFRGNNSYLVSENKSSLKIRIKKLFSIFNFYIESKNIIEKKRPEIIHAHATFFCCITAIIIGKQFKIPVCYEIRSLWEERELNSAKSWIDNIQPKIIRKLETLSARNVNKVFVINQNLKHNIEKRGIEDVVLIPNAVNVDLVKKSVAKAKDESLISFGYIGSLSPIEGLHLVLEVWHDLEKVGFCNIFHIYGGGTNFQQLKNLKERLKIKNVKFHGKIPPHEIFKAYQKIDVMVYPRIKINITDTVTPLKPLEAMLFKKLVIASDVGGMKELIENDLTGLLFKADSKESLKNRILEVIDKGINRNIINTAKNEVITKRNWRINAQIYQRHYIKLLEEIN